MILFIGDLNCRYWLVNHITGIAEKQFNENVTAVLQLGDFGLFKTPLNAWFNGKGNNSFTRPVYFIDGNHEDFLFLKSLTTDFSSHFTHLPRGTVHNFNGFNFLCLGGAAYMDPVNTPSGAVIREEDIQACMSHQPESVDVIITHDCPRDIGVPGNSGFEYCGPTGFSQSSLLRKHFTSKTWLFAHHHRFFEYKDAHGSCYGLPEAQNGFAVMDRKGRITMVEYRIENKDRPDDIETSGQILCRNLEHCLTC